MSNSIIVFHVPWITYFAGQVDADSIRCRPSTRSLLVFLRRGEYGPLRRALPHKGHAGALGLFPACGGQPQECMIFPFGQPLQKKCISTEREKPEMLRMTPETSLYSMRFKNSVSILTLFRGGGGGRPPRLNLRLEK